MGALPEEEKLFTYADYKAWELKEGERYELIYGKIYPMFGAGRTPPGKDAVVFNAPDTRHQIISGELFARFHQYFRGKPCKVTPAPYDVRLFYAENESDDTVVQPDIIVVCDEKKRGYEGCRGAPDFVAEILSPTNTVIEMRRKLELYRKAGVREYWVVDPEYNEITAHFFGDNAPPANVFKAADTVEAAIFPGLVISLEEVFAS